jgi:hypothetical protein
MRGAKKEEAPVALPRWQLYATKLPNNQNDRAGFLVTRAVISSVCCFAFVPFLWDILPAHRTRPPSLWIHVGGLGELAISSGGSHRLAFSLCLALL